jgi:hypothetical protein
MAHKERERPKQYTVEVVSFRSSGSYPYFKTVMFLVLTFATTLVLILLNLMSLLGIVLVLGVMGAVTLVFGLSPALTEHQIGAKNIIFKHGWYFNAKVPLDNIRDVEETEEGIPGHGMNALLGGNRLYLANSRVGLVKIKLYDRQMMGGLLGRFISEVVTNVDEPGPFVKCLRERAGLKVELKTSIIKGTDNCPTCGRPVPEERRSLLPEGDKKRSSVPMIECIFLVHNDGRLIASYKSGRVQTKEAFSVMGMFTAIQDFVKDAFKRTDGNLKTLVHGDLTVLLERGKHIYLAVVLEGGEGPPELRKSMQRSLTEVEAKYGYILVEDWDGELTKLEDIKKLLAQILWT